jgi:hypothetical protein
MKTFTLINPLFVGGNMKTEYNANSGLEAVSEFWNEFGSHLSLNCPKLYVTLQDGNGKLSHYKINEKLGNDKTANFTISEFDNDLSKSRTDKFLNEVDKYKKEGHKLIGGSVDKKPKRDRSKDSSSSSTGLDSDDDEYYNFRRYRTRMNAPFNMMYYTPLIYSIDTVVLPTFLPTISPYVTLYMPVF